MVKKLNQKGFSLVEVMVAITLFSFFITAFLTSQGYNITDSELSEQQLMLQQLCEKKINELQLDPPKFENLVDGLKETKSYEESDLANYQYTLEIKKLTIPDFAQLFAQGADSSNKEGDKGADQGSDYFEQTGNRNTNLEKLVFDELKKNIERIIWQVRVTVVNKESKYSYSLATWVTNHNEKVQINVGF